MILLDGMTCLISMLGARVGKQCLDCGLAVRIWWLRFSIDVHLKVTNMYLHRKAAFATDPCALEAHYQISPYA